MRFIDAGSLVESWPLSSPIFYFNLFLWLIRGSPFIHPEAFQQYLPYQIILNITTHLRMYNSSDPPSSSTWGWFSQGTLLVSKVHWVERALTPCLSCLFKRYNSALYNKTQNSTTNRIAFPRLTIHGPWINASLELLFLLSLNGKPRHLKSCYYDMRLFFVNARSSS